MRPWRMFVSTADEASCRHSRRVLQRYLDGELAAPDAQRVRAHLERCRRCGMEEAIYREIKWSLLRSHVSEGPDAVLRLHNFASGLATGGRRPETPPDAIQ